MGRAVQTVLKREKNYIQVIHYVTRNVDSATCINVVTVANFLYFA